MDETCKYRLSLESFSEERFAKNVFVGGSLKNFQFVSYTKEILKKSILK